MDVPSILKSPVSSPPTTKLGQGYVLTRVCDSVHSGGSASVHAGIPPPPGPDTPPSRACWKIRSTSGRYASYWNAILFDHIFQQFISLHKGKNGQMAPDLRFIFISDLTTPNHPSPTPPPLPGLENFWHCGDFASLFTKILMPLANPGE